LKLEFGEYHLGWCGKVSHPGQRTSKVIHNEYDLFRSSYCYYVVLCLQ